MDAFSDFDTQFEQTLALVNGGSNSEGGEGRDPNQFRPAVGDKRPEYLATLRFIPPANGPMFVKKIVHFMKIGNRTQRVICPKTLDPKNQCDICADNIQGHRSKEPALVARAKDHGNKIRWVANVLVIEDQANPDNVGRVMWWEFPNQIMEYIEKLKNPPNSRIPSINAFHPIKGADFFLCMKQVDGFTKYDGSQFLISGGPTPIGDERYISDVRSLCHDIQSQIVIPSAAEIAEIMSKVGGASFPVVQKTYGNLGQQFEGQNGRPAPSVGGFNRATQIPDEFDAAVENARLGGGYSGGFSGGNGAAPAPQAPQAPAPKPAMAVPQRPSLQTAEAVMPPQQNRVAPIPPTPATAQPHSQPPKDDEQWYL